MVSTVKAWKEDKGFGFIHNPHSSRDIFVHHTDIIGKGRKNLRVGQSVEFQIENTEKGDKAVDLVPL